MPRHSIYLAQGNKYPLFSLNQQKNSVKQKVPIDTPFSIQNRLGGRRTRQLENSNRLTRLESFGVVKMRRRVPGLR